MFELAFAAFLHGKLVAVSVHPSTFKDIRSCSLLMRDLIDRWGARKDVVVKGVCAFVDKRPA